MIMFENDSWMVLWTGAGIIESREEHERVLRVLVFWKPFYFFSFVLLSLFFRVSICSSRYVSAHLVDGPP